MCCRTFQSPTNGDVPRTEKCVTHNQIGNVPTKRLVYYNSATRLPWTGEEQGRGTHRITTFSLLCVQALLQHVQLGSVTRPLTCWTFSSPVVCTTTLPNGCQVSRTYLNLIGWVNMDKTLPFPNPGRNFTAVVILRTGTGLWLNRSHFLARYTCGYSWNWYLSREYY